MGEKKINDKASGGVYSMRDLVREKLVNYWTYIYSNIEIFTLNDKYTLMTLAILILIVNIGLFLKLQSFKNVKKLQLKKKKSMLYYSVVVVILLISSLIFITLPYLEKKTIVTEQTLCEVSIDNEAFLVELKPIENAFYPEYNDSVISWYTKEFKDERYLHSEKVNAISYPSVDHLNKFSLFISNNSTYFAIQEAKKPVKYRGTEATSYWYSLLLILYNIFLAIAMYPLYSIYKQQIKLFWKTQYIVSSILLAITINQSFLF